MVPMLSGFHRLPLIDCHVHHRYTRLVPEVIALMERAGVEAINVVSTPDMECVNLNPQALEFKARYPRRVYVFGSLDYSELMAQGRLVSNLADQVDLLQRLGCDGVKMVEGKPMARKLLPLPPFDEPEYEDFFTRLEDKGFPLLFHVADPEEFWDEALVPPAAKARGWFYGDPSYPTKEELYTEVGRVLERHPKLRVIFAHFYFLSADLSRAAMLLDTYPYVHLDICPGIEMYVNFSRQPEATRDFFLTYQDRIIYGTDTGSSTYREPKLNQGREIAKYWYMRMFLETEGPFQVPSPFQQGDRRTFIGIELPGGILRKIYCDNFRRLVGDQPAPLNLSAAYDECQRLATISEKMGRRGAEEIRRIAEVLEGGLLQNE